MRSYAVEQYIGSFVGNRCSVLYFTHQAVHNAYVVTGTATMVTDGSLLGLVWFQDTSLVAVALL